MKKIFTYMMTAIVAMTMFTSCESDDHYLAETLMNRDWQGYLETFYYDRWGLSGKEYNTVMRFEGVDNYATSGRGYELDYRINSWRDDYAYCTFKWFIVDGELTLIYDDNLWQPIYIVEYHLTSSNFYGRIDDGTNRKIQFDFVNEYFEDWSYYGRGSYGNYGDFRYYNGREMKMDDFDATAEQPLVLDRTELARQQSGVSDAVSVASGCFAKAMME